jgi:glutamate N-acetyltransferase/amino-acid N-acetyltransferase
MMESDTVIISVDLSLGEASAVAWGCDLTYDYVRINAEYTT